MPACFTLIPAFALIRGEITSLLYTPKLSIDKSQIRPENHKTLIIYAGFLLIFSFLS